jgi:roadblock/LC7 domain-containing protein
MTRTLDRRRLVVSPWKKWFYAIAAMTAAFVAVASVAQAIREGSWTPIVSVGWLPAVVIATWPGSYRRCLHRRRTPAG